MERERETEPEGKCGTRCETRPADAAAPREGGGAGNEKSLPERGSVFPFEEFWRIYDKKLERARCLRKYAAIPERDRGLIRQKLPAYVEATPDPQYRKNPLSWLNGQCWLDEMVPPPCRAGRGSAASPPPPTGPRWSDHETGENVDDDKLFM